MPLQLSALAPLAGRRATVTITGTGTDELLVSSRTDAVTARPQLVLTYLPVTAPAADVTPPTVPTALTVTSSPAGLVLTWGASSDAGSGVSGYEVHASATSGFAPSASTLAGTTTVAGGAPGTTLTVPARAGTWYYRVVAKDAAGNRSAASSEVPASVLGPEVRTLTPTADTYVNEAAPSRSFGTTSTLSTRGEPGSTAYLRFSVPAAPAGRTLTSAVLRFRTTGDGFAGSADLQSVRIAGDAWTETGLTWPGRPPTSTTSLGSVRATAAATAYRAVLSPDGLRALQGRSATLAVTSSGADSVWFWSAQHANASYRPSLVLTWS